MGCKHGARHKRYIDHCIKQTKNSSVTTYRHFSVLVKGGRIISTGVNRNRKGCLVDSSYPYDKGWHSELDLLYRFKPEEVEGATLYISGVSKGGNVVNSCPCKYCMKFLSKYNLKAVYYSMPNNGYGKLG